MFFGRNVTNKVSNQKTLYYAISINLLLHYLVKRTNAKIAFSPQCRINALPEFYQLLDFFKLFDSRLTFLLLYDSLSFVINAFSYREYLEYWEHGSGERKSIALQQLDYVAHTMHQHAVFWGSYFAR